MLIIVTINFNPFLTTSYLTLSSLMDLRYKPWYPNKILPWNRLIGDVPDSPITGFPTEWVWSYKCRCGQMGVWLYKYGCGHANTDPGQFTGSDHLN